MNVFYQFAYGDHRVGVISSGEESQAREFLVDPRLGGLRNDLVSSCACVVHVLPDDMALGPVSDGAMTSCWSSWRVTDWVYGVGDGVAASVDSDKLDIRHAVIRTLMVYGPCTMDQVVERLREAGFWFLVRVRAWLALRYWGFNGRASYSVALGHWEAETRR